MASARPAPGGGTPVRPGLVYALCAALIGGCTSPNPFFMRGGDAGDGARGTGGSGGTGGAASGGSGGAGGSIGSGGTGGAGGAGAGGTGGSGTGGPDPGTGGSSAGAGGSAAGAGGATAGAGGTATSTGGASAGSGGTGTSTGGATATGGATGTGGSQPDMSPSPDVVASDAPTMGSPPPACGSASADVSAIVAARGIAVDNSGTIYFTREAGNRTYIGRWPRSQAIDTAWFQLPNGTQPRLLRLDNARELLHVSDTGGGNLFSIGYTRMPVFVRNSTSGLAGIHGLAVAEDGAVFVSSSDGYVYRLVVDLVPIRNMTTTAPIFPAGQRPLGLAFGPGGYLYVGSSNGRIKRFRVLNNMLVEGTDHGGFSGAASDLAFDTQGRLYVADGAATSRPVSIVAPDGTVSTSGPNGLYSGLAFGRGMLTCQELYASDSVGPARTIATAAPSLNLP
jgi:hypothetical protein